MDNTSLLLLSPPGKFTEFVAAAASMWSPAQFLTVAQVANLSFMEDIRQQTGLLSLEMYRINWPGNPAFFYFRYLDGDRIWQAGFRIFEKAGYPAKYAAKSSKIDA